jgi:type II secretory ATPase GspE/PulE/Tfp pilus assembly ATPase PilB-like protein
MEPLRFRHLVLDSGLITADQLAIALAEQERTQNFLGEIIINHRFACARDVYKLLSRLTGYGYTDLEHSTPDGDAIHLLTEGECHTFACLPFKWEDSTLSLAMADPENILVQDKIKHILRERFGLNLNLQFFYADPQQIEKSIYTFKYHESWPEQDISAMEAVSTLLCDAVLKNASDIHIYPGQSSAKIRLRVDGELQNYRTLSNEDVPFIINRIKVLAGLNITETRKPQSGSFQNNIAGHDVDIRVSIHGVSQGESVVLRILDKSRPLRTLEDLGFNAMQAQQLRHATQQPHGLILCCGPTGSGKTTTLYALLHEINHNARNIMTLEDPIEYVIPTIRQSQIQGDMTFAEGVRSMLRHDPDVILIGEIRDSETAQIAIRAALTGHLVLSTVHASDVWNIPTRLMDLGISPILLTGQIICGVNQRLVPQKCTSCQGEGCTACNSSGLKGRRVEAEVIPFSGPMQRAIAQGVDAFTLQDTSRLSSQGAFR